MTRIKKEKVIVFKKQGWAILTFVEASDGVYQFHFLYFCISFHIKKCLKVLHLSYFTCRPNEIVDVECGRHSQVHPNHKCHGYHFQSLNLWGLMVRCSQVLGWRAKAINAAPARHLVHLSPQHKEYPWSPKHKDPKSGGDEKNWVTFSQEPSAKSPALLFTPQRTSSSLGSPLPQGKPQTHIVLRGPTEDARFALYALPLVGLDGFDHVQGELQAGWVTWRKPEAAVLGPEDLDCLPWQLTQVTSVPAWIEAGKPTGAWIEPYSASSPSPPVVSDWASRTRTSVDAIQSPHTKNHILPPLHMLWWEQKVVIRESWKGHCRAQRTRLHCERHQYYLPSPSSRSNTQELLWVWASC
jgi:hypothetical protein